MMKLSVAILAGIVAMSSCGKKPEGGEDKAADKGPSPCSPEAIEAFFSGPEDAGLELAQMVCDYPPELAEMLETMDQASPDQRMSMLVKFVFENGSYLEEVCPAGGKAMQELGAVAEDEQTATLVKTCGLGDLGLATVDEMQGLDPATVLAAAIVYGWMQEQDVDGARKICRRILGVE